jgi:hypothetical protein
VKLCGRKSLKTNNRTRGIPKILYLQAWKEDKKWAAEIISGQRRGGYQNKPTKK